MAAKASLEPRSIVADHVRNRGPRRGDTGRETRKRFRALRGIRRTAFEDFGRFRDGRRTNAERRPAQAMCDIRTHPIVVRLRQLGPERRGLPLKKRKHLAPERPVAEGRALQMRAVDRTVAGRLSDRPSLHCAAFPVPGAMVTPRG